MDDDGWIDWLLGVIVALLFVMVSSCTYQDLPPAPAMSKTRVVV